MQLLQNHKSNVPSKLWQIIDVSRIARIDDGKKLGSGSFGEVRIGTLDNKPVALKILHEVSGIQAEMVQNIVNQELNMLAQLKSNPYHVQLYGACMTPDNRNVIALELMDGDLFKMVVKNNVSLDQSEVLRLAWQILNGIVAMHERGMLHRDLKAANVLVKKDSNGIYHAKLADLGTAKNMTKIATKQQGTLHYMAPEVYKTSKYSYSADMYSYGIVLYELLVKKYPYHDKSWFLFNEESHAKQYEEDVIKKHVRPSWPDDFPSEKDYAAIYLQDVAKRCWNAVPEKRPSCIQLLVEMQNHELFRFLMRNFQI